MTTASHDYPRVCGSEVLCLLARSGWARFLGPAGTDHRATDGEQHSDNPLSNSCRTAQPLFPEADPFVQDETLNDGSTGCKKKKKMMWNGDPENCPGKVVGQCSARGRIQPESEFQTARVEVTSRMISVCHFVQSRYFSPLQPPHRQTPSFTNSFEPLSVIIRRLKA